ncbi:MAG TPA: DbpA RNA binding domain-containing protein, partial [Allosphingosinicella sp.]
EDTIWFRMNIGRQHNADPRWLLPLLCRRGHITRNDIGAIRIAATESMFEVPRAAAARFAASVKRTATDDDGEGSVRIEAMDGKPRDAARENRRAGPPSAPRGAGPGPRPGGPRPGGAGPRPDRPRAPGAGKPKAFPTPWKAKAKPKRDG